MIEHTSHSSISSYLRCGKAFELEKIKKYPTMPAWWLIAGSAIHTATEWIDTGEWDRTPEEAFDLALFLEVQKASAVEPDETKWLAAGWGRSEQRFAHWQEKGRRYVAQWADRGFDFHRGMVELDVSTTLPSGLEIKAYIDRVHVNTGNFEIYDLKSGSTRPESDQQLGIYKVLLDVWLNTKGTQYTRGLYTDDIRVFNYMFKDDEFYEVDVSNWDLQAVDKIAQQWYRGVRDRVFLPVRGSSCGRCSVSEACFLQSGDTATTRAYDELNPFYKE